MKTFSRPVLAGIIFGAFLGPASRAPGQEASVPRVVPSGTAIDAGPVLGSLPLVFAANEGQVDGPASYYALGRDKAVFFCPGGISIALSGRRTSAGGPHGAGVANMEFKRWAVQLEFVGADPSVRPAGEGRMPAVLSFFKGRPEEWRAGVAAYSRVAYRGLWPGIDLVYSGDSGRVKYEFVVGPGADPSKIGLRYRGATGVGLRGDGRLEISTPLGSFQDDNPIAFQVKDGVRVEVPAAFALEDTAYGFVLGEYDRSLPLVLDPAILIYCGYVGGPADDRGTAIARDSAGNVYLTGWTESVNFPVAVGPDLTFNTTLLGPDAFVAKVNAAGTDLVYCGFIGGDRDDTGTGIAVDASGSAYVTGWTHSLNFPVAGGPGLSYHGGTSQFSEGFVAKVNPSGTGLVYSGFVGGSDDDRAQGIALDASGNAYLTGWTASSDFPRLSGPDLTFNGVRDAFVAKVAASGAGLVYSGYIGGSAADEGTAIAVDGSGKAHITGFAESRPSERFPVAVGPFLTHAGGKDAFVARVDPSGSGLEFCGYIGGSGDDLGSAIALDASGNAYVAGATSSRYKFPALVGPSLSYSGAVDAFVAKVDAGDAGLDFCGFIGGTGEDQGTGVAVDSAQNIYVTGFTDSTGGFPVTGGPGLVLAGLRDAFIVTVKPSGEDLFYGGFLGGSDDDEAAGVAVDGLGNIWLAGHTRSTDFPVIIGPSLVPGAGLGISEDAFAAKIFEKLPPDAPANLRASGVTVSSIVLAWDDESGNEDGFEVERKSGSGGTWSRIAAVNAGVETATDSGLSEAQAYFYRVRAYNDIGDSAYSNEAELATLPAAPTELAAAAVNSRRVDLAWVDNSNGETGFRIERRTNPADPWIQVGTSDANVTAYQDRQVREETTYYYRVLAFNIGGGSAPSNITSATTPVLTIPEAPSNLQATAFSSFIVDLAWTDNSYDEDGFRIERKTGAGGTWSLVATAGPDATAHRDPGLSEETAYFYRVRAYNNAGESSYSNEASVTTPEYRPRLRTPIPDISFGSVNICGTAVQTTTLYNDGAAPLTVSAVTRTAGAGEWTYAGPATPFIVPAAGSLVISVRFAPTETVLSNAAFTVASNDPDAPSAAFAAAGTGFLPSVTLALEAQRLTERAWIIRRDYARLEVTVNKSAPFAVTTYRLSRRSGSGSYETVRNFTEADFASGVLLYNDTFLATGMSYVYKMDALDCLGRIIASSSETGPLAPPPDPKIKARALKKRVP